MPKSQRKKNESLTLLKKAAGAKGQQTLLSSFGVTPAKNDNVLQTNEGPSNELPSASAYQADEVHAAAESNAGISKSTDNVDVWVTRPESFTENDKKNSRHQKRPFIPEWLNKFSWLQYHREKSAAFCKTCSTYKQSRSPFVFSDDTSKGFQNWKKIVDKANEHEQSENHKGAEAQARQKQRDIAQELHIIDDNLMMLRREGLIAHLETIKTLVRQGLALRGHLDTVDSDANIAQFNKDKAKYVPGLQKLIQEKKYLSKDIICEQEEMLVLHCRRELLNDINECHFFSIICDEATDISKTEQMSFSVRHCNRNYEIEEDFIGIYPCDSGLDADALLSYIKDIITRCSFTTDKLIGTAFDGAAVMNSLSRKIKEEFNSCALHMHCFAHSNELVFKDISRASSMLREAQDLCQQLYALAGVSPKRVLLFESIQREKQEALAGMPLPTLRLKSLSTTRWTTRGPAAAIILEKHDELVATLESLECNSSVTPECRATASGLLRKLKSFTDMFGLTAMHHLAVCLEKNSKEFQRSDLTGELAITILEKIEIHFKDLREGSFGQLMTQTQNATGLTLSDAGPTQKRQRKVPSKMSDYACENKAPFESLSNNDIETDLLAKYIEAIDNLLASLQSRFDQLDIRTFSAIGQAIILAANGEPFSHTLEVLSGFKKYMQIGSLENELKELPTYIKLYNAQSQVKIKHVTMVSTVCDILNWNQSYKECLPNVHKLLQMYLTIPFSSATAERTFSVMRRVKTWLRSTMSSSTLNNKMFPVIHKERFDKVDVENIAKEFVSKNEKRQNYFGKF